MTTPFTHLHVLLLSSLAATAATTTTTTTTTVSSLGHQTLMELAVAQANLSQPIESAYCVGCVIVPANSAELHDQGGPIATLLATGFSRELPGNTHAEECALLKMKQLGLSTAGCDMYTTMEPCSKRLSGNDPCVKHTIAANIGRVFIGAREPDHFVKCEGVDLLRADGVEVYDVVYDGVRTNCLRPNQHIAKFNTESSTM